MSCSFKLKEAKPAVKQEKFTDDDISDVPFWCLHA
jgi:hypothetical protein